VAELLTKADLSVVKADLAAWVQEFDSHLERQAWQLTFHFGVIQVVTFGVLAAFLKLT
jgi:hypothetical protein